MYIYRNLFRTTRRLFIFLPFLGLSLLTHAQQSSKGNTTIFGGAEITIFGAHNFITGGSGTQPGIIKTIRTIPLGVLKFGPTATQTGSNDANHVDGYVSKIGNTAFTFPTGNGTDLRTLSISAPSTATAQITAAWISGNPGTVSDPSDAATHSITSLDGTLTSISQAGFWDWIPVSGSFSGLTVTASIPNLSTFSTAADLRLAGWNGTQWVNLTATSNATGNTEGSTVSGTIPSTGTITALAIGSVTPLAADPVPFTCNTSSYQVVGESSFSRLYAYDILTGTRTSVGLLDHYVNAIGYNDVDNLIWGYAPNTNEVVRIDAAGIVTPYIIPNLPANAYNVGDVLNGGYLFLYTQNAASYYVVDINPARTATYLKLVDPTLAYALETAPYGTTMSALAISDWSYNPKDGLFYALQSFTAILSKLDPATGTVVSQPAAVTSTGANIVSDAQSGFGAAFFDNAGNLYVFANGSGDFYRVNTAANTAILMSTSIPSGANDGARCNLADPTPLPVTLISFSAEKDGTEHSAALLKWVTSYETNADHFEIEHSKTGKNWNNIGQVNAKGESTAQLSYSFKDSQPENGENLYRLRMIDRDGTFAYSRIQSLTFDISNPDLSIYPNPSADKLFIRNYSTVKDLTMSSLNGTTVFKSTVFASGSGFIDLTRFAQGMYIIKIARVNGDSSTHKILVFK